jgi:hypothetical protein
MPPTIYASADARTPPSFPIVSQYREGRDGSERDKGYHPPES